MDKFTVLQKRVKRALAEYEKLRRELKVEEPMLYETIQRESQPFIKGHFTLAVVGEMSAGKSTFINALLGQRGLLPSAYGQTTCALTEIVDSNTDSIEVTFADGKKKTLDSKSLRSLVAIPSEFENLPVNEVNKLIIQGKSFNDICKKKAALSKLQSGIEIDESLLRKYVSSHNKTNIPIKVIVRHSLPEAYKGWKIVDTPGVGAIGGIEQATREFINSKDESGYNNVDAIIFVNSGRLQLQRSGFNQFVEDTFDTIYEEARRRMFLIITCAADPNFIAHEKEELDRAKKLFIDKYKLKEERLVCVDSICSMFLEYVKEQNLDLKTLKKKNVPADWNSEDWEASIDTRNVFKNMLEEDEVEADNKNLLKYFDEYSGINELREKLNDFAEQEKSIVFRNLMSHINKDVTALKLLFKKNEETLGQRLNSTKEVFAKKVKAEKNKLDQLKSQKDSVLQKIRTQYSKQKVSSKFDVIESQALELRKEDAIYKVRNKAENLLNKVQEVKTKIYDGLSSEFEFAFTSLQNKLNIVMPTIDFATIARNAEKQNTTKGDLKGYAQKKTDGFVGGVKRFFGSIFGEKSWGYEDDRTKPIFGPDKINHDKELKDFKDMVILKFQENLTAFVSSISDKIELIGSEVSQTIDSKVISQQKQYDAVLAEDNTSILEKEYNQVAAKLRTIEQTITIIEGI
jgi:GTPase Era involved in 16S rRNA processing